MEVRIQLMIDIIIRIINCTQSEAHEIIMKSEVYRRLKAGDYATLYQSIPCCIDDIGIELRKQNSPLGNQITSDNIIKVIVEMREDNLKRKLNE